MVFTANVVITGGGLSGLTLAYYNPEKAYRLLFWKRLQDWAAAYKP